MRNKFPQRLRQLRGRNFRASLHGMRPRPTPPIREKHVPSANQRDRPSGAKSDFLCLSIEPFRQFQKQRTGFSADRLRCLEKACCFLPVSHRLVLPFLSHMYGQEGGNRTELFTMERLQFHGKHIIMALLLCLPMPEHPASGHQGRPPGGGFPVLRKEPYAENRRTYC